ncbi:MAG: hypothetical protein N838_32925 [Thiohalocapsa sp. PB-PSB1]|nr:MAG: hypothetical protein N838_32925 [Thiohalocapsa sp. PB-PSB1]
MGRVRNEDIWNLIILCLPALRSLRRVAQRLYGRAWFAHRLLLAV